MSAAGCGPPPIVRGIVNRRVVGGVVSFKVRYASAAGQRAPDAWVGEELLSAAQVESFLARRRPAAVAPAAAAGAPSLQARVDRALQQGGTGKGGGGLLLALLAALAGAGETTALVAVYDAAKGRGVALDEPTWRALQQLHDKGKGRVPAGGLRVPAKTGRSLAPARRLHKIMKGRRLGHRSDAAKGVFVPAMAWVASQRQEGRRFGGVKSARERIALAKELRAELSVTLEVARGVVTKLKQKKLLA